MADQIQQPYNTQQLNSQNQPPLTNEVAIPVRDGEIPVDQKGIATGKYDSLDPIGNAQISFKEGNYNTVAGLPKLVSDKVAQLVQTLIPLISVALIELMGNNSLFQYTRADIFPSFDNSGKILFEGTLIYTIEKWIGQDIELENIQHDSNYVLEKIKPAKANITKCEIDTGQGTLTIQFTM